MPRATESHGDVAVDMSAGSKTALEQHSTWRELGMQSLNLGEIEEALWCLRRAIELCSEDPITWQLLGHCFELIGEERRASRCYKFASRQLLRTGHQPPIPGALAHLGQ